MTLRLTVDTEAWDHQIATVVTQVPGLVPVIKGNGYGFGRRLLAERAARIADTVAVGTIHEAAELGAVRRPLGHRPAGSRSSDDLDIVVLTPTVRIPSNAALAAGEPRIDPILTVSSSAHVDALTGSRGPFQDDARPPRVLVKILSSMRRYGTGSDSLDDLVAQADSAGLDVVGVSIHLPLAGTEQDRYDEVLELLPRIDPAHEVWLSHLTPGTYAALPTTHHYRLRLGTSLWHGDKSMLHLSAEVLETRNVSAGDTAGYQRTPVPGDGTLVMIGAGTAHGVHPLPDGRSPFHHRRTRLGLLEPPHMHTSMAFVPVGSPAPVIGERVDVQRPLTTTQVEEIEWR